MGKPCSKCRLLSSPWLVGHIRKRCAEGTSIFTTRRDPALWWVTIVVVAVLSTTDADVPRLRLDIKWICASWPSDQHASLSDNAAHEVKQPRSRSCGPPERVTLWRQSGVVPYPVMVWTGDQTGEFLDSSVNRLLYPLFHLIAYTGLRRGEACGQQDAVVGRDRRDRSRHRTGPASAHRQSGRVKGAPRCGLDRHRLAPHSAGREPVASG